MNTERIKHYRWMFIVLGVVIGLGLAAGFKVTRESHADDLSETQAALQPVSGQDIDVAEQLSNAFARVAAQVNPSVVTIFTETTVRGINRPFPQFFGNDDFFRRFFNMPQQPQSPRSFKQQGLGSGVIVSKDGLILTNNHVVEGADKIKVRLLDGTEYEATVKGTDKQTDLAVIKIEADDLKAIKIGDSDKARVGQWVLAIGSPLSPGLDHTVTAGIISAKGRSGVGLNRYEDFIQTDAAINPGNSGGAMVNLHGELIGINAAIASKTGGFMGIGFAIPINLANKVMQDLLTQGKVSRGWLGVYIQSVSPELAKALGLEKPRGVIITSVQKDSPAEKAGLKAEDVILKFNGKDVDNSVTLSTWVAGSSPGEKVKLTILRDGDEKTITVELGELNNAITRSGSGRSSYDILGLTAADLTDELASKYHLDEVEKGVVITKVEPESVADEGGLRPGDMILKFNRKAIESLEDLDKLVRDVEEGDNILLFIRRGEANIFVALTIPEK
ncbi:MAG: DegQ family serine endoprotease [Calditrichaeota bacterium]|nr:MAG: DegQ family serine endoprotease [Calditrichota bacterium]